MEAMRFNNLVRDLNVNDQAWSDEMRKRTPPNRCYIILFSARSGSTWLTTVLSGTNRLGQPEEYINPDFVAEVARACNAKLPAELLEILKRRRKSPNGVFGMEARAVDIELFGAGAFFKAFSNDTIFFHLWRENIVAQGISLFRAIHTNYYHSNSSGIKSNPEYDAGAILQWTQHVANTENENVRMLQHYRTPARHLLYEEVVASRQRVLEFFSHALAVPFNPGHFSTPLGNEPQKLADAWSVTTELRFRNDHAAEVDRITQNRLVKIGVAAVLPPQQPKDAGAREVWSRGNISGSAGRSPRNNPFKLNSTEYHQWAAGWRAGWDDQPYTI